MRGVEIRDIQASEVVTAARVLARAFTTNPGMFRTELMAPPMSPLDTEVTRPTTQSLNADTAPIAAP